MSNTFEEVSSLGKRVSYGRVSIGSNYLEFENIKIILQEHSGLLKYLREGKSRTEKYVAYSPDTHLLINPVEPTNLPKPLTDFILLEFTEPIIIAPSSTVIMYSTFPIEIGVFVVNKKNAELLDVFSLVNQKYTLYGTPRSGVVCRYWRTRISTELPEVDLLREGIMKLKISNNSEYWVTVSNLVLNVNNMTIYYDDKHVSTSAQALIYSQTFAETFFVDEPLRERMSKSLTTRAQKRLPVIKEKFVMEWGL
ncbi:MAG: DUF432 domain-containing protein [Desulfurococcaceae archaeon TW002]